MCFAWVSVSQVIKHLWSNFKNGWDDESSASLLNSPWPCVFTLHLIQLLRASVAKLLELMKVDIHNCLIVSCGGGSSDDCPMQKFQLHLFSPSLSSNHVDILAVFLHLQLIFWKMNYFPFLERLFQWTCILWVFLLVIQAFVSVHTACVGFTEMCVI